jgi:hypothetical protein
VVALLVAAARQAVSTYPDGGVAPLLPPYESALARGLSRRQRRLLEELAPHIAAPPARPPVPEGFHAGLLRAELRAAYLLTGDWLALVDDLASTDASLRRAATSPGGAALVAVLEHPLAGDVARFALTPEAAALRRRLGAAATA